MFDFGESKMSDRLDRRQGRILRAGRGFLPSPRPGRPPASSLDDLFFKTKVIPAAVAARAVSVAVSVAFLFRFRIEFRDHAQGGQPEKRSSRRPGRFDRSYPGDPGDKLPRIRRTSRPGGLKRSPLFLRAGRALGRLGPIHDPDVRKPLLPSAWPRPPSRSAASDEGVEERLVVDDLVSQGVVGDRVAVELDGFLLLIVEHLQRRLLLSGRLVVRVGGVDQDRVSVFERFPGAFQIGLQPLDLRVLEPNACLREYSASCQLAYSCRRLWMMGLLMLAGM